MTKTNFTVSAKATIALGYKVQRSWEASPTFFNGYKVTKEVYDTALATADTAHQNLAAARERKKTELARLKAARLESVTQANAAYKKAAQDLSAVLQTTATTERDALVELSRLANGARFYAKSVALSDGEAGNDALGKSL